jgi:hypothetical protein
MINVELSMLIVLNAECYQVKCGYAKCFFTNNIMLPKCQYTLCYYIDYCHAHCHYAQVFQT